MADEELSAAEIADARQAFLSEPPEILDPNVTTVDDAAAQAAAEAAALDELTQPPAAPEGASTAESTAPPPAPVPTGTSDDPYAQFGGEQAVREALAIREALRTEQGVRLMAAQSLTALGYSPEQVRIALDAQAGAPVEEQQPEVFDPFAGLEDDDVVTVAQTRTLIQQAADQAAAAAIAATQPQVQMVQDTIAEQQQTQVRANTDAAIIEVLGAVPAEPDKLAAYQAQVNAIVQRGQAYYDPAQWQDPNHIRQAVQRANAELVEEAELRFKAFLEGKKQARDSQPVNIGGGAGGEGELPEPKNMGEARAQAQKTGFFQ